MTVWGDGVALPRAGGAAEAPCRAEASGAVRIGDFVSAIAGVGTEVRGGVVFVLFIQRDGTIHRVDPKFASWLSSLSGNSHTRLRVDPDSGSTL